MPNNRLVRTRYRAPHSPTLDRPHLEAVWRGGFGGIGLSDRSK